MKEIRQTTNSHIEKNLDDYCNLNYEPGFALLLKGKWGSGKTWFINTYREKLKEDKHKYLYVSLYGMTSFSEIEYAFFQQLHPILSSKGMAITGKIIKGVLKATLQIDLNADKAGDGTLNVQVPDINLPEYLKDINKNILIFDDLERCKIDLSNLLGYINYFVEHQGLKVILVANEEEFPKDSSYSVIKEKLIGKTFEVTLDFEGALENFITTVNHQDVRQFLSDNIELIQDIYIKAEYENLRILKQTVLDFEKIFNALPEKAKSKPEVLQDLLMTLMAFSIEIRRGKLLPRDISQLQEAHTSQLIRQVSSNQSSNFTTKDNNEETSSQLQIMLDRYFFINLYAPVPSSRWWQLFFDKGIIDTGELEQSILNSKYFQDENTPNWVKLWHYSNLTDDEFTILVSKVESEYINRHYFEIGVIQHVFGLLLMFSNANLYNKGKEQILQDFKLYIDNLKDTNRLTLISSSITVDFFGGLGFQGKELEEFNELSTYIEKVQETLREESMLAAGQDLLAIMQSDFRRFYKMICQGSYQDEDAFVQKYYEVPILKYIEPSLFVEKLLPLSHDLKRRIFWSLKERYKLVEVYEKLVEELEWLKSIQTLLLVEQNNKQEKLSGYVLEIFIIPALKEVIKTLELKTAQE